jgi:hypothetical protein
LALMKALTLRSVSSSIVATKRSCMLSCQICRAWRTAEESQGTAAAMPVRIATFEC